MLITKLISLDKKRYIVYVDGSVAFVLYKGDIFTYRIEEGKEISDETYDSICQDVLAKRALLRLGHLLEKRDYTEKQLVDKLREGYYPDVAIDYAINKVKGYGFVDDDRYAIRYIESALEKKSKQRIRTDLISRGITKDIINRAFEELEDSGVAQDERAMVHALLVKRHYYESDRSQKEKAKQFNYLLGKGFSINAIKSELELDIT